MFDIFDKELKAEAVATYDEIIASLKLRNPKKVFPVLQIHYQEKGEEKPIVLPGIGEVLKTIITAEYLLYLFKSEDEYYYLSLRYDERSGEVEIETDGKALGKYNDILLKGLSHGIPMVGIAYGNPKYSIDFADVDIAELFFQPLNTQDKYSMDYSSQFHKEDILGFVKNFG